VTLSKKTILVEVYKILLVNVEGSVTKEFGWAWKIIAGPQVNFFGAIVLGKKYLVRLELVK